MKVTVLNKKTMTIIGLVAMLVIAAVINVSMKNSKTSQTGEIMEENPEPAESHEVETASSISASKALAQYDLERQTSIQQEMDYLDEIINSASSDKESIKTATEQKMLLLRNLNTEKLIAEILVAKGFNGITVVVGSESVNILVDDNTLDDSKVAQILDTTTSETDIEAENIKIIPLN